MEKAIPTFAKLAAKSELKDLGNKPIALDFRYNGGSTQDSQNNQGDIGGKWDSSGDAADDPEVYIEVNNGDYFSGTVPEEL